LYEPCVVDVAAKVVRPDASVPKAGNEDKA